MKLNFFSVVTALIFFALYSEAYAQSNERGRGTDGQAYRIDEEGTKLVDQLAELEVTIDEYKKRIIALENEIDEKDQKLNRVLKGKSADSEITERDIIIDAPKPTLPEITSPDQSCSLVLTPLRAKISTLEREVSHYKTACESLNSQPTEISLPNKNLTQENCNTNERVRLEQNAAREQLLRQSSDYELEFQSQKSQSEKLRSTTAQLQDTIQEMRAREVEANSKIESLNNKISSLESSLAIYDAEFSSKKRVAISNNTNRSFNKKPQLVNSRSTAVIHGPRELDEKVNIIQKLINERKSLHDRLQALKSNVLITMQPLKTSNGETLDELRKQIRTVASEDEQQVVLEKLSQIERILNEDLKVLKRLSKI